jgi:hypothetical protein
MLVEAVHERPELGSRLQVELLAHVAEVAEHPEALGPMLEADVPCVGSALRQRLDGGSTEVPGEALIARHPRRLTLWCAGD